MRAANTIDVQAHNDAIVAAVLFMLEHNTSYIALGFHVSESTRLRLLELRGEVHRGTDYKRPIATLCQCARCVKKAKAAKRKPKAAA